MDEVSYLNKPLKTSILFFRPLYHSVHQNLEADIFEEKSMYSKKRKTNLDRLINQIRYLLIHFKRQ